MVVRRQDAVFHTHQVIETQNQVRRVTIADQNDLANIGEAEVAIIRGNEFIFEGCIAVPDNPGCLAHRRNVLPDFALLVESAVRAQLVVTSHNGCVRHRHQFPGTVVRKLELLSNGDFAVGIAGLCVGLGCSRVRRQGHRRQRNHTKNREYPSH